MAKFYGEIGFAVEEVETRPGVWQEGMIERPYMGDLTKNSRQLREGEKINDDLSVQNTIEIVADAYAREHFFAIRYAKWAGAFWKVDSVEVRHPRLLLRLGGIYNGQKAEAPTDLVVD